MTILQPKILVVDDEPDLEHLVRQRMRREIRSGTYSFMFAQNGVEALEVLNEEQDIDMVLSDINMPRMDGLTLLEQIPKVDPNIRSVIVSAYGDMKNIRTAMNRGAFDFVTKPIDFEDLRVTIQRDLAPSRAVARGAGVHATNWSPCKTNSAWPTRCSSPSCRPVSPRVGALRSSAA